MAGAAGGKLSGGQRQRISFARALLKDAPVVVLDEATAYVDPENAERMNDAVAELVRDKTVIVIAHRLSTIANADKVVVLDEGRVAEAGTHYELLEADGLYARMIASAQAAGEWSEQR